MRVVITGGGTGGHLYPGIALAEELKRRDPSVEIIFVGNERGIEGKVIPREGYPIKFVPSAGFVGKGLIGKMLSVLRLITGLRESYNLLGELSPDLVVGTGGYVSLAPVIAARLHSLPVMILEQNSIPGKTNKLLGHISDAICITYQESMARFPRNKVYLTGNPVRERILRGSRSSALKLFGLREGLFTIFIFGGSSGARSINSAMVNALQHLLDFKGEIQFLHQTGERDFEFVRDSYRTYGYEGTVTPYIYQMPEAYAVSDLVISRAGATTIAEICATGKAAILIPYPYAAANHQEINARKLSELGASVMIKDGELTGERLADEIIRLYKDHDLRKSMRKRAIGFGKPDAVRKIADIAMSLVHERLQRQRIKGTKKEATVV